MLFQGILGLLVFVSIAWLISEKRSAANPKMVIIGIFVQIILALLLLKVPLFQTLFLLVNSAVTAVADATHTGTSLVFGFLGGAPLPFDEKSPGSSFVLAFNSLPIVLVISALSALLFHWGILPRIVHAFAWLLQRTMKLDGAVGLGAAANVFVGMVESPLLIRPYIKQLTRSELFILMSCGMATIAGTMMVLYASILEPTLPGVLSHILTASLISVPAAIVIAQLMVPETSASTAGLVIAHSDARNSIDAITRGTMDGVKLLINIIAMLIVFVALVALLNMLLSLLPTIGDEAITLQRLLGYFMAPLVWLMGIPWSEAVTAGSLMGIKTILNEFLAYIQLAGLSDGALSERSRLIMIYALCGFANFGSLGIMIGGLNAIAPE